MNFRGARSLFERLLWRGYAKSQSAKLATGGAVTIQTPRCPCSVSPGPGSGMVRLRLALREFDEVHRDFIDFLQFVDDVAARQMDKCAASSSREMSSSVYVREDGEASVSAMTFFECEWFDESGNVVGDPMGDRADVVKRGSSAACIWEFGGVWMNDSRWGVKWNVKQVKVYAPHKAEQPQPQPALAVPVRSSAGFLFLDDDEATDHLAGMRPAAKKQRVQCLFVDD